jgi:hypothetical protein
MAAPLIPYDGLHLHRAAPRNEDDLAIVARDGMRPVRHINSQSNRLGALRLGQDVPVKHAGRPA